MTFKLSLASVERCKLEFLMYDLWYAPLADTPRFEYEVSEHKTWSS